MRVVLRALVLAAAVLCQSSLASADDYCFYLSWDVTPRDVVERSDAVKDELQGVAINRIGAEASAEAVAAFDAMRAETNAHVFEGCGTLDGMRRMLAAARRVFELGLDGAAEHVLCASGKWMIGLRNATSPAWWAKAEGDVERLCHANELESGAWTEFTTDLFSPAEAFLQDNDK